MACNVVVMVALEELESPGSNHAANSILDRHASCSWSVHAQSESRSCHVVPRMLIVQLLTVHVAVSNLLEDLPKGSLSKMAEAEFAEEVNGDTDGNT